MTTTRALLMKRQARGLLVSRCRNRDVQKRHGSGDLLMVRPSSSSSSSSPSFLSIPHRGSSSNAFRQASHTHARFMTSNNRSAATSAVNQRHRQSRPSAAAFGGLTAAALAAVAAAAAATYASATSQQTSIKEDPLNVENIVAKLSKSVRISSDGSSGVSGEEGKKLPAVVRSLSSPSPSNSSRATPLPPPTKTPMTAMATPMATSTTSATSTKCDAKTKAEAATATATAAVSTTTTGTAEPSTSPTLAKPRATTGKTARNVMLHPRRSLRGRTLNEKYRVDWNNVLGEGAYGSVHPARLAATGEKVALKKISKRYTNSSTFKKETNALLRIYDNGGHPGISGLKDMYEDYTYFYLLLDLVSGGEMFEHLINYGAYSEMDAARLIYEVASALAFLHGVGVVHADLKPENLLLCSKNRCDGTIKIIDFGCAVVYPDGYGEEDDMDETGKHLHDDLAGHPEFVVDDASTGTTAYWPPERFKKGSMANKAMDIWSVGVILYIMLTGVHPFDVEGTSTDEEIEEHIKKHPYPPIGDGFTDHLSDSAIDLVVRLMEPDPRKRLTAYEMLQHPWVRGVTASDDKIADSDKRLSRFKDLRNKLEAGLFSILVSHGHRDVTLSEALPKRRLSPSPPQQGKGGGGGGATAASGGGGGGSAAGEPASGGKEHEHTVNEDHDRDSSTQLMKKAFDVFDAEGKGYINADDLGRIVKERTGSQVSSSDTQEFLATKNSLGETPEALSLTDFSGLFSGLRHKHFSRGNYIFHAGDQGDSMYFLCSGKVEVQTRKGQLVAILRSGDFFGEGSLLSSEQDTRFTTAKCTTPVDVIQIKREDFERYVASSESTKNELRLKWRARHLAYAKNLIRLQTNVKTRILKKGDVVYREGDFGTSMYRVFDQDGGQLDVSHGGRVIHQYMGGDSFGESSLLFERPRSSTVTCTSDRCTLHEMHGEDFLELVNSSPEMAAVLRNMCRKRFFKKAVKQYSLEKNRGLSDDDIVAAFHDVDIDGSGSLSVDEVRQLMHRMDPNFPVEEIRALLKFVDINEDGTMSLEEFKRLFRQFEDEKN